MSEPLPPRLRSVFCIVTDQHGDRAVAETACGGRFTHDGDTLGLEADGLSTGLAEDRAVVPA